MTIASFCRDRLLAEGPLPLDVLADRAAAAGVTTARDPAVAVRSALLYKEVLLADGRWATPLWLLEGRVLTARRLPLYDDRSWLSFDEAYDDEPEPDQSGSPLLDLALLDQAVRGCSLPLVSGGVLRRDPYGGSWRVPKGWPGVRPQRDQLLGLRVRDGEICIELVPVTDELQLAGRRLADELGPLDAPGRYWRTSSEQIADDLTAALWERLAADPSFLTSPVPPLSECIPPLALALRGERERRAEAARRWRPQLDLPSALRRVAVQAAWSQDQALDDWLNTFVSRALREVDELEREELLDALEEYGEVLPLQRGRWR